MRNVDKFISKADVNVRVTADQWFSSVDPRSAPLLSPRTWLKCRFLNPTLDFLKWKLGDVGPRNMCFHKPSREF